VFCAPVINPKIKFVPARFSSRRYESYLHLFRLDVLKSIRSVVRAWPGQLKVASASTTAAASTASTTTPAAATPTTPTTAISATPAAGSTSTTGTTAAAIIGLRTRFVHHNSPAHHIFPIECGDGLFQFGVIRNFHESESPGLAGRAVANYGHRLRRDTHALKLCPELFFRGPERKITYIEFFQRASPNLLADFIHSIAIRSRHAQTR
jgi:hypothetical protein